MANVYSVTLSRTSLSGGISGMTVTYKVVCNHLKIKSKRRKSHVLY